jgi:hypothetical protein
MRSGFTVIRGPADERRLNSGDPWWMNPYPGLAAAANIDHGGRH